MDSRTSDTQAIKARISLADVVRRYVELRPMGSRLVAPCPFHQETKPSFSVNDEQGTFYCFGCQASGDLFDFYGRINGLDFKETLEQLAEEAGVRLERSKADPAALQQRSHKRDMLKMHESAKNFFQSTLHKSIEAQPCRSYVQQRGISEDIQQTFGLGFSSGNWQALQNHLRQAGYEESIASECGLLAHSDKGRFYDRFRNRLMFPIFNLSGQAIAFGGRIIPALMEEGKDEAKYINSSDSPIYKKGEHIYGLFQARPAISVQKRAMLTEGYMDVLTLHQFGYKYAVGVLGTALTPEQVKRISGFCSHVELLFDGDRAGRKAALRASEMLLMRGLSCSVVLFPEGEDIDSLLRSQGQESFEQLRSSAPDGLNFCIQTLRALSPREAVEWARDFLAQVEMPELFHRYASVLAQGLNLTEHELRSGVVDKRNAKKMPNETMTSSTAGTGQNRSITRDRVLLTFAVRYPTSVAKLQEQNADLLLTEAWAKKLWNKLSGHDPAEVFCNLDDKEKQFWMRCREGEAPPLSNEDGEWQGIVRMLESVYATAHTSAVKAALQQGTVDIETQREYMRAIMAAQRRRGESKL